MKEAGFITRSFHKTVFTLKKYSPEICIAAGIVGTVVSTVLACRATLKAKDVLEEHKEKVDYIHKEAEKDHNCSDDFDEGKEITKVYTQTGIELAKRYAPAIIIGGLSITSLISSHYILRKRSIALAAAYAAADRGFKEYRERVVNRFGEDVDRELKYNLVPRTITEETVDEETGKKKKVKKVVNSLDLNDASEFARVFSRYTVTEDGDYIPNDCWNPNMDYNFMFLKSTERYMNDILRTRGMVFLNEVYSALGFPATKAGQVVGWRYSPRDKNSKGDNYIDFGAYEANIYRDENDDYEKVILLDFNVDGNIWSDMD